MKPKIKPGLFVIIISFLILLLFRLFNPPYIMGKIPTGFIRYASHFSAILMLSLVIYGLIRLRRWAFYLALFDIFIGFLTHLYIIVTQFVNPSLIQENFVSQNTLLNSIILKLYIPLTFYWVWAAYYIYKNRALFGIKK